MSPLDYPYADIGVGASLSLADGIEWIRLPLPFPPGHVNVYRLAVDEGALLVDTGYADEETTRVWRAFAAEPPAPRIVVTHFHPDHIGQAARLEVGGARIYVAGPELAQARALHALPGEDVQSMFADFFHANGVAVPEGTLSGTNRYRIAVPALPERADPLAAGSLAFAPEWSLHFAGGHSPAHALLFRSEPAVIAAGDILLPTITPNVSVWPNEPEADPLGDYLAALEGLRELPADTLVLPAHGLPYRGLHVRIEAIAAHHEYRLDLLRTAVKDGGAVSAADVIPRLFPQDLKPSSLLFAHGEALAHLNRLWHLGEFDRSRARDGIYRYGI